MELLDNFVEQFHTEIEGSVKQINGSVSHIPRKIAVKGDVYGFTTVKVALAYGAVLIATFFGSWLICNYYRSQAQRAVIYQQAKEVVRERDYYYNQIQTYKRNNSTYARLFPTYDDKGFWGQFNKQ